MTDHGIGSWIRTRGTKSATDSAVVFEDHDLSYAELADRVARLSSAFQARGIRKGDRVAYLGENHPSFLETFFAAAQLGAIFVPLNTRHAAAEISGALADSGSEIVVVSEALSSKVAPATSDSLVRERIVVRDESSTQPDDYELILRSSEPSQAERDVSLDDPAMILYTSGTTGKPKGALLTHGNLTWNSFNVLVDYDIVSTDRALMVSPLFHVASLGMGTLPAFLKGATVVLERKFDAERVLSLIGQGEITWMSGVPTTFQMLVESPSWASSSLGSLTTLTCGGSPVPLRVLDAYEARGLSFTGGYGMTEAAPGVTSLHSSASLVKAGSAGLPHFFTDVRLARVEDEVVGEIQVRGPNVIERYWNRPVETAESFTDDGWFRTGDLGRLDAEGYLFVTDRLKDMIISGGENVYPAEVELLLDALPEILSSAVVGVSDAKWGEVPIAVVTVVAGTPPGTVEQLVTSYLDGKLARYKIPKRVVVVDELPRTPTGKVQKAALRSRFAAGEF